jgi:hypothetical protein
MNHILDVFLQNLKQKHFYGELFLHQLDLSERMVVENVPNGEEPVVFFGEILV